MRLSLAGAHKLITTRTQVHRISHMLSQFRSKRRLESMRRNIAQLQRSIRGAEEFPLIKLVGPPGQASVVHRTDNMPTITNN